jgi:predicted dehydrogenase
MPTSAATTSAANEGSAAVAWSEDVDFEQEGTITVVSIYAEFHWHTQYTDGGGSDNSYSKIQITGDGGSTWVDLTDTFANPTTGATTIRERNGVGRWISAITSGANQLQFRLVHWVSNGSDTSAARIRSNSYVRITYRKAP